MLIDSIKLDLQVCEDLACLEEKNSKIGRVGMFLTNIPGNYVTIKYMLEKAYSKGVPRTCMIYCILDYSGNKCLHYPLLRRIACLAVEAEVLQCLRLDNRLPEQDHLSV